MNKKFCFLPVLLVFSSLMLQGCFEENQPKKSVRGGTTQPYHKKPDNSGGSGGTQSGSHSQDKPKPNLGSTSRQSQTNTRKPQGFSGGNGGQSSAGTGVGASKTTLDPKTIKASLVSAASQTQFDDNLNLMIEQNMEFSDLLSNFGEQQYKFLESSIKSFLKNNENINQVGKILPQVFNNVSKDPHALALLNDLLEPIVSHAAKNNQSALLDLIANKSFFSDQSFFELDEQTISNIWPKLVAMKNDIAMHIKRSVFSYFVWHDKGIGAFENAAMNESREATAAVVKSFLSDNSYTTDNMRKKKSAFLCEFLNKDYGAYIKDSMSSYSDYLASINDETCRNKYYETILTSSNPNEQIAQVVEKIIRKNSKQRIALLEEILSQYNEQFLKGLADDNTKRTYSIMNPSLNPTHITGKLLNDIQKSIYLALSDNLESSSQDTELFDTLLKYIDINQSDVLASLFINRLDKFLNLDEELRQKFYDYLNRYKWNSQEDKENFVLERLKNVGQPKILEDILIDQKILGLNYGKLAGELLNYYLPLSFAQSYDSLLAFLLSKGPTDESFFMPRNNNLASSFQSVLKRVFGYSANQMLKEELKTYVKNFLQKVSGQEKVEWKKKIKNTYRTIYSSGKDPFFTKEIDSL